MASTDKYSAQIKQPARELSDVEVNELLTEFTVGCEITNTLICNLFAATLNNNKARFNTYDTFMLPANTVYNSKNIQTTIGRLIFNTFVLPESYLKKFGYNNNELTKKNLGAIESNFAKLLLDDEISVTEYNNYINKAEWLSMSLTKYITPSLSYDFIKPIKKVIDKRNDLFDKYASELKSGNNDVIEMIEKELVSDAEKELKLKNNPSYELYTSGEFKMQNYKKASILGGGFKDLLTNNLKLLKSNYVEGVSKNEYADFSQYTVIGAYSRGVATQLYGSLTKVINSGMQNTLIDFDKESDCGTKVYLNIKLLPELKSMYKYRYIVENGKNVLLTPDNIDNYLNKDVKLRTPMFCKNDKLCCKCCGELFHRVNIKNPQLLCSAMSGSLMNKSMKKFHDTSTKFTRIDYTKFNHKF